MKYKVLSLLMVIVSLLQSQTIYYVAPDGNDSNSGTDITQPLKTPQAALAKVTGTSGGYLIYLRGGVYRCTSQVKPPKAGVAGNVNKLWAYPGETPILDFTGFSDRGLYISKDYWHIKGIEVRNCGSNGICISSCGYVTLEGCVAHDCGLEGIKITGSSTALAHDILVLNCDSYRNYDAANHGENADGFAAKTGTGSNIVFRGCRAWYNSDDGWDFYSNSTGNILIDSCWAFRNGINLWGDASWAGDGDGFKLGGAGTTAEHTVRFSVAFDNMISGFAQNHANAGQTILNCTGYRNKQNNFSFYEAPTGGTLKKHVLKNNLSFATSDNIIATASEQITNSWQGVSVTAADFVSLDTALALAPRNSDYSLPSTPLFRLAATSNAIDRGTDIGFPYRGMLPDLGAFEYESQTAEVLSGLSSLPSTLLTITNYPNPFNPTTNISFRVKEKAKTTVKVYNLVGCTVATLYDDDAMPGKEYTVQFDGSVLPSGVYFAVVHSANDYEVRKLLLLK